MAIDLVARLSLDDQMSGPLSSLNSKMMGMVGFAAIAAGTTSVVKSFADFDTAMRKAATIAGATDDEFVAMSDAAKELGSTTSLSASQVADAMTEMAAKGYSATQVIDAMPGVIAAAEASSEDLALTADVVSTALNVWGMEASKASDVADVLAMTANATSAGIGDMQYALKYAGAPAKALGMSLEEVSAAAGTLVNNGMEGSQAGTALRQGLSQLVGPTKKASEMLDAVGFSATDADGKVKSMVEIVGSLKEAMNGMGEAERVSFLKTAVGTESMTAFLSLVDSGPEKLAKLQKKLENSSGAAEEAAEKMKAGIGGALMELSGKIDSFKIEMGGALEPAVRTLVDAMNGSNLQPMIDSMASFGQTAANVANAVIDNWRTIQNTVVLAAYALGVYKTYTLAVATAQLTLAAGIAIFNGLKTAINLAKAAQIAFNLALLANPIGVVIAAVTALIGIGILLYQNWDKVTASTKEAWNQFKQGKGIITLLLGPLGLIIKTAITIAKEWKSTESVWSNVWNGMKASAEDTVNTVIAGVNKMIDVINKLPGVNIPIVASVNWTNDMPEEVRKANASATVSNAVAGPHALGNHGGWNEIRTDGTLRNLHAGERVLTAVENDGYKQMMSSGLPNAIAKVASMGAPKLEYQSTEQEPFDATEIIGAINRSAKRAINVYVPNENLAGKLSQMVDVVSDKVGLTSGEAQAVSSTVENSSFSDSVNTITTNNAIAKTANSTTEKNISPVYNFAAGAFAVREEADVRKITDAITDRLISRG